jgi:hypothetical protein
MGLLSLLQPPGHLSIQRLAGSLSTTRFIGYEMTL